MQKVISILIVSVLLFGCSAARRTTNTNSLEVNGPVSSTSIAANNLTKRNFFIQKAEIEINADGNNSGFIATLKYQATNEYLISIRTKTGIEVARIYISGDTILANDRINKKLLTGSPGYIERKYGIRSETIPLIFGDIIVDSAGKDKTLDCKRGAGTIEENLNGRKITYLVDCEKNKIREVNYLGNQSAKIVRIEFSNFEKYEDLLFPQNIRITDSEEKSFINIYIRKITSMVSEKLRFIPGEGYEKIILK